MSTLKAQLVLTLSLLSALLVVVAFTGWFSLGAVDAGMTTIVDTAHNRPQGPGRSDPEGRGREADRLDARSRVVVVERV